MWWLLNELRINDLLETNSRKYKYFCEIGSYMYMYMPREGFELRIFHLKRYVLLLYIFRNNTSKIVASLNGSIKFN